MSTVPNPPKLPPQNQPVIDPKTGQMTKEWYTYLLQADDRLRKLTALS